MCKNFCVWRHSIHLQQTFKGVYQKTTSTQLINSDHHAKTSVMHNYCPNTQTFCIFTVLHGANKTVACLQVASLINRKDTTHH